MLTKAWQHDYSDDANVLMFSGYIINNVNHCCLILFVRYLKQTCKRYQLSLRILFFIRKVQQSYRVEYSLQKEERWQTAETRRKECPVSFSCLCQVPLSVARKQEGQKGESHKIIRLCHCAHSTGTTFKDVRTYEDNVKHSNDLRVQSFLIQESSNIIFHYTILALRISTLTLESLEEKVREPTFLGIVWAPRMSVKM